MSIAEHGAPTEGEINVLLIARAMGGRFDIDGCVNEHEARVHVQRLVARRFGDCFANERGEFFRSNSAGSRFLCEYLAKKAAA